MKSALQWMDQLFRPTSTRSTRRTFASIWFEGVHGRVPRPGDILRYEELAAVYGADKVRAEVERIQGAWARRLPEWPCPSSAKAARC
jgi:hypothetical protein